MGFDSQFILQDLNGENRCSSVKAEACDLKENTDYTLYLTHSQRRRHQQMGPHDRSCVTSWGFLRTTHWPSPGRSASSAQLSAHCSQHSVSLKVRSRPFQFSSLSISKVPIHLIYKILLLLKTTLITGKAYKQQSSFTRNPSENMTNTPVLVKYNRILSKGQLILLLWFFSCCFVPTTFQSFSVWKKPST